MTHTRASRLDETTDSFLTKRLSKITIHLKVAKKNFGAYNCSQNRCLNKVSLLTLCLHYVEVAVINYRQIVK